MVEIALALGILSFAILIVFALLPTGLTASRESSEKLEASGLMTRIVADFRNADSATNRTRVLGLSPLPVRNLGSGEVVNPELAISPGDGGNFNPMTTWYLNSQGEATTQLEADSRFRLTIRFTKAPSRDAPSTRRLSPVEAHFILSWPPTAGPFSSTGDRPSGMLEKYLTFPLQP